MNNYNNCPNTFMNNNQYAFKRRKKKSYFKKLLVFLLRITVIFSVIIFSVTVIKNGVKALTRGNENPGLVATLNEIVNILSSNEDSENDSIYSSLKDLADDDSDFSYIYERREKYPPELLNSLNHNTELLGFVKGYFEADKETTEGLTQEELESENPLFIQWDKRWGYTNYGDTLMAVNGCGPTCLSMAVVSLTGDKTATPYNVAQFSYENGYYIEGNGTAWKLFSEGAESYGLSVNELSLDKYNIENSLDNGDILVLAVGPGSFTSSGHYIVVYNYNENGFMVNDPNSYKRSEMYWSFEEIRDEINNIWALSNR